MNRELKFSKYYSGTAAFFIVLAILLRIIGYFRSTSFFLDELNVARNVAEKNYWEMFFPLKYEQYAPPFFMQLVKGSADIFGYSEDGLRLVPMLAGIGSLIAFYGVLRRFFDNLLLLYPLVLFIFNFYLYQQGMALKQYPLDVLMTCIWLYLVTPAPSFSARQLVFYSLFGMVSVWLSMPMVFILVGVGFYFLHQRWMNIKANPYKKAVTFQSFLPVLLVIGSWLISFGVLFWVNLRHGIQTDGLQQYHTDFFLEMPFSFIQIQQSFEVIVSIFRAIVGKTGLAIAWAIGCSVLGIYQVGKLNKGWLILLILPVGACFLASLLHYYSLIIRLTLFLFPIILILMGFGVQFLVRKINFASPLLYRAYLTILLFLMAFSCLHRNALPYLWTEYVRAQPRDVLELLAKSPQRTLPLYVTSGGVPAHDFYTKNYAQPIVINSLSIIYGDWNDNLHQLAEEWKKQGIRQIWLFDNHTFGETKAKMDADIHQIAHIEIQLEKVFSRAYLLTLK